MVKGSAPTNPESKTAATFRLALLTLVTTGFLVWTIWLLMGPIQSKYRDYNRIEMAGTLDSVERAMQNLIAGVALIPPEPADDALRRWRVLFITYRRLIEQMRPEDPALGEIADYLVRIYTMMDRAEVIRKDILAGKYTADQIKTQDREFRKYVEVASEEVRAAAQSLRRAATKSSSALLGSPYYPIAAGFWATLLCAMLCRAEWKRLQEPMVEVIQSPWPEGKSPFELQQEAPAVPSEIAALIREPYFEPNGMDALRRLAGRFAHNFNNLLTIINGYTDLVLYSMEEKDPNRYDLEEVKKAGERAAFLTGHLLAFSGRQVAKPKLVDLSELIRNMQATIEPLLGPQSHLELDLSENLDHVQVDPVQFEQVVLSLVGNAWDAMPEGGTLTISTANAKSHQIGVRPRPCRTPCVITTFRDTGLAMDEQTRDQIFEPFFTTHEPGKGTGLGLSAAYGIIRQNGGTIRVRSDKGQGTTFTLYFPSGEEGGEWAGAAQLRRQQARFKIDALRPGNTNSTK